MQDQINIRNLIDNENILMFFQPIVSIRKSSVIGIDALCRGIAGDRMIPPKVLYHEARKQGLIVEFDRLCRKKALEGYARLVSSHRELEELLLFINFDAAVMDDGVLGSGQFIKTVEELGINPKRIVIEIVESKVNDTPSLKKFVDIYRNYGFIIALDDMGTGYSNLNRLALLKPDVIKIDITIIRDIDKEFYKQEVLKSLVSLSKKVGSIVIAEGVESEEEAVMSLYYGADMIQGYYLLEPMELNSGFVGELMEKNEYIAAKLKDYVLDSLNRESFKKREFNTLLNKIVWEMAVTEKKDFDEKLKQLINIHKSFECIYVLDSKGIQVSGSICDQSKFSQQKKTFFQPAEKGTDHSTKDYFYVTINSPEGVYITESYISLASGNLCSTISTTFIDPDNNRYLVCIDINHG